MADGGGTRPLHTARQRRFTAVGRASSHTFHECVAGQRERERHLCPDKVQEPRAILEQRGSDDLKPLRSY